MSNKAYYNELDPKAAAWLRELIKGGHIAPGDVDERSIEDVRPADLRGYTQHHFFAGIGGWSYALRLAGWPDDRPVWTGSCPCQPFSAAGKGKGFADERHLWPAWFHLIRELRPDRIFGEQVANALGWLDLVSADLEKESYAVGAAIMGAHSVGAPHIRQRLYWMGNARGTRTGRNAGTISTEETQRNSKRLGNGLSCIGFKPASTVCELADTQGCHGRLPIQPGRPQQNCVESVWRSEISEWIACTDGKSRPVEPGTFPLAHGIPGRVGLLRGYGNAIVPQDAAEFIGAYLNAS